MSFTFQQLRTQCAYRFTDPNNQVVADTAASNQRNWADYVNQAYLEVLHHSQFWPWNESSEQTLTVPANTRSVALPTDCYNVNWAYDSTNDLRIVPDEGRGSQYRGGYQLRSTTNQIPTTFKIRGGNFEVYPLPTQNTTYVAECVICPSPLSANGDIPIFPSAYHQMLVDGALYRAYLDDGAMQEAAMYQKQFNDDLDELTNNILSARSETYAPIRDAFWG